MNIEKYISPLIQSQFPSFYQEDGKNFVAFVKAYYEWMEQTGYPLNRIRTLPDNTDIDTTLEEFIEHFRNEYVASLPANVVVDQRLLIKHIVDLYESKGTKNAIELLFRILFNEDIQIYVPNEHILKSSDGTWIVPHYIEVSDSKYNGHLPGKTIRSASGTAVVESCSTKVVNNKAINVLYISNLEGQFTFGERVFCDDLYVNTITGNVIDYREFSLLGDLEKAEYSVAIDGSNAPFVFGSLSAVGVRNGGSEFEVGDILQVQGSGEGGRARVVSTRHEHGKVSFDLIDGGFGFSTNAIVTVTGGGGSGASFEVGGIVNKTIYEINTDHISDYYNTQLTSSSQGFALTVSNSSNFSVGQMVYSNSYYVTTDAFVSNGSISNGEVVSNTSLGISLYVQRSEDSLLILAGNTTSINNGNLVPGVVLKSSNNGVVTLRSVFPVVNAVASGTIAAKSGNVITINSSNNTFFVNTSLVNANNGANTKINGVVCLTNWAFPRAAGNSNLDGPTIGSTLAYVELEVGTISYIANVNPGIGYSSAPTASIVEPEIYNLRVQDDKGRFFGYNSVVSTQAGTANGVVTGIEIIDSGYGYSPLEKITLSKSENASVVTGTAVIDLSGIGSGYWLDNKGFISDQIYVQDSDYYQLYSYEILAKRMKDTYEDVVKTLVHPTGMKMFGRYVNYNELDAGSSEPAGGTTIVQYGNTPWLTTLL